MERSVCLLWHCHQPPYRNVLTGDVLLPWVRLHAARAYAEMPLRLLEVEGARATLNLTPVLMDQLEDCRRGVPDVWWTAIAKPASDLTDAETRFLQRSLTSIQGRALDRWPAYRALADRLSSELPTALDERARALRDLSVWFLLAWCGPTLLAEPALADLLHRGAGFTEEDKRLVMDRVGAQAGIAEETLGRLQASGQGELSASPYYHPILPLLCDAAAADPAPGTAPALAFRHPDEARLQVIQAHAAHTRRFGRPPAGYWPSEGAVSPEALEALGSVPLRWIVTDHAILRQSLSLAGRAGEPGDFLTPHRFEAGGRGVAVFFRDTALSDRIGFEYAGWPDAERAAEDLVARIDALPWTGIRPECVTLALDGENAWGYYADGGKPFLLALYRRMADHPRLRMRTFSEFLDIAGGTEALPPLSRIGTGSWIDGNLGTWAANPRQRRGWALLAEARARCGPAATLDALHVAEASDWFWWLSDDHRTDQQHLFVGLFAGAIRKACRDASVAEPEGLSSWEQQLAAGTPG